jgi:regulator of protease activity HflC (stomatin/prohibitin superfamily)
MLLEQVLTVLTWAFWIILLTGAGLYLWRTARLRGLGAALRQLLRLRWVLILLALAIGITLIYRSVIFVEPQQVGVVISLVAPDGYRDRPLRSGLRFLVPLAEEVKRYPIYWQTYTMASKPTEGQKPGDDSILARTADGQEVSLDSSVIFQVDTEEVIRLHIEWQGRYIEDFVRPVVRGLVRTQVSQYTVDEVNSSKRLDLERDLDDQVRAVFQGKGLILDRFILRNIAFSPEYAAAVEQKQIALQGKIQAEYQAEQVRRLAQGEADATRTRAQGEAEAVRTKAAAQADALTLIAQALARNKDLLTYQYIEKLSPAIRVMLVPSNVPYILPLPSMEEPGASATPAPAVPSTSGETKTETLPAPAAPVGITPAPTRTPTPTRGP